MRNRRKMSGSGSRGRQRPMLQDEQRGVGRRKQFSVYAQFPVLDSCRTRAHGSFSRSVLGRGAGGGSGSHGHRGGKNSGAASCAHGRPAARALSGACRVRRKNGRTDGREHVGVLKVPHALHLQGGDQEVHGELPHIPARHVRDQQRCALEHRLCRGARCPERHVLAAQAHERRTNSPKCSRRGLQQRRCTRRCLRCLQQRRCTRRYRRAIKYRAHGARSSPQGARSRASRALQRWQSTPATQRRTVEGN